MMTVVIGIPRSVERRRRRFTSVRLPRRKLPQGEVDIFDFTVPAFVFGSLASGDEIGFDVIEPVQHSWVDIQQWATHASMFVDAWCGVGSAACAEFDFAFVEVGFKLGPFVVGDRPVLLGWPNPPPAL